MSSQTRFKAVREAFTKVHFRKGNNHWPKVSVIVMIPLKAAALSLNVWKVVKAWSIPNYEVIVVRGSTDSTAKIAH